MVFLFFNVKKNLSYQQVECVSSQYSVHYTTVAHHVSTGDLELGQSKDIFHKQKPGCNAGKP